MTTPLFTQSELQTLSIPYPDRIERRIRRRDIDGAMALTHEMAESRILLHDFYADSCTVLWSFIGGLIIMLADSLVRVVYTVNYVPEPGTDIVTAASATSGINTLAEIIQLILAFLGPLAILFTIYAGFLYMTAFQDEEKTGKAKQMIIGGITGIVVIYSAYAIVSTFFLNAPNF